MDANNIVHNLGSNSFLYDSRVIHKLRKKEYGSEIPFNNLHLHYVS